MECEEEGLPHNAPPVANHPAEAKIENIKPFLIGVPRIRHRLIHLSHVHVLVLKKLPRRLQHRKEHRCHHKKLKR